jgi:hypothetical protein
VGSVARKPRPTGVQVASLNVMSDVGPSVVAQAIEGEEDEEPRPDENGYDETVRYINPDTGETVEYPARFAPRKPPGWVDTRDLPDPSKPIYFEPLGGVRTREGAEAPSAGTVADAVAPGGAMPGAAARLGIPRTMPASDDPDLTARAYVSKIFNGQRPMSLTRLGESGGFVVKMPDDTYITFRPAGQASERTPASTASVDINGPAINALNGGARLKLKFPRK